MVDGKVVGSSDRSGSKLILQSRVKWYELKWYELRWWIVPKGMDCCLWDFDSPKSSVRA